ncbi:DUF4193 domain-containing protein [Mycobacterium montefiorense]|uniref:DUF4193 domain-containing protein n=1 Tax=Mycobacterium montefiorense TaxID=154654 RepID=UPI0021F37379|nr:DUF4193 domain-containing protein [Mycobacterium montefiorense]MCV7426900.1 DUF4193 domain-containing protein [Mycobacterium montefiorense]GLE52453.1 dUTPase [Mycobacterium montefiorense]
MKTASDYDARRVSDVENQEPAELRQLDPNLSGPATAVVDEDPNDVHFFELPGADLSGEELAVTVIPQRSDEFTCSTCFLVQHRHRMVLSSSGLPVCTDCA